MIYTFRFGSTNKTIQLNEEQLIHIPYLSLLITHKNDFQCGLNDDGEYVLHSRIRYNWFNAIFQATLTGKISSLFTELPEEANVCGMLQLYEYLCLDPIPLPLVKNEYSIQLKLNHSTNNQIDVVYREASDAAVQFMIALRKHEYNTNDSQTLKTIFKLLMAILIRPKKFGVRLCHHAFTIAKKDYISLFSVTQQHKLYKARQSIQDNCELALYFPNVFGGKSTHLTMKELQNGNMSSWYNINHTRDTNLDIPSSLHRPDILLLDWTPLLSYWSGHRSSLSSLSFLLPLSMSFDAENEERKLWVTLRPIIGESYLCALRPTLQERAVLIVKYHEIKEFHINQIIEEKKKLEARSARSGHFNTSCKRITFDKFKHRYGPKTQKYR
mgnify:FL=1